MLPRETPMTAVRIVALGVSLIRSGVGCDGSIGGAAYPFRLAPIGSGVEAGTPIGLCRSEALIKREG